MNDPSAPKVNVPFAVLPAAFATLAHWPTTPALALAVVMLARNFPTVLTVRTYLRLNKGGEARPLWPIAAAGFARQAEQDLDVAKRKGYDPARGIF